MSAEIRRGVEKGLRGIGGKLALEAGDRLVEKGKHVGRDAGLVVEVQHHHRAGPAVQRISAEGAQMDEPPQQAVQGRSEAMPAIP